MQKHDDLLEAAREWREAVIPNTSTAPYPAHRKLMEAIAAFDDPVREVAGEGLHEPSAGC